MSNASVAVSNGRSQADFRVKTERQGRLGLVRDLVIFQIKLALDGIRDVIMSPLSLLAGAIGIVFGGSQPRWAFNRLMRFGQTTDRWINLFEAYGPQARHAPAEDTATVDDLLFQIEERLRRDYAEGGLTAKTRTTLEASLDRLRRDLMRSAPGGKSKDNG